MKKIIILLIILTSVMCLSACKKDFTECGDESQSQIRKGEKAGELNLTKTVALKSEYNIQGSRYYDGSLYYYMYNDEERESQDDSLNVSYYVCKYNLETGDDTKLFDVILEQSDTCSSSISSIYVNPDGDILLYCLNHYSQGEIASPYYEIDKRVYGLDGTEKSSTVFEKEEDMTEIASFYIDSEDNTYVMTFDSQCTKLNLIKYNAEGKRIATQKMDQSNEIALYNDKMILNNWTDGKSKFGYYNIEKGSFDPAEFKTLSIQDDFYKIIGMYKNSLLIIGNKYLYSFNCENHKLRELINLKDNYLDFNNISYIEQTSDNDIFCVYSDNSSENIMYFNSGKIDNSTKTHIKIATINCTDSEFINTIYEFNRDVNNDFVIDLEDYGSDKKDSSSELMNDIMTGNIPDIYIVNNMNHNNLVAKDMLEDLKTYIKKDDTLNESYFIDGYLDSMTSDGKQYVLSKTIMLDLLIGNKAEISKYADGWNIEDLMYYYRSKHNGTFLFSDSSAVSVFNRLLIGNINHYIDWKTGKCSFNSDQFKKVIEFCKTFNKQDFIDLDDRNKIENLRTGKLLFLSDSVNSIEDIQLGDISFNGTAAFIGYPSDSESGIYSRSDVSTFAISSKSDHKDIAWKVIKKLMTGDYMKYDYTKTNTIGIPVSKKDFNAMEKFKIATEKYTDEDGNEVTPVLGGTNNGIEIGQPTPEQFDILKEMIRKSKFCNNDNTILNIIVDDVKKYFEDDKGLDDTVDVIQDKMIKYVNENK